MIPLLLRHWKPLAAIAGLLTAVVWLYAHAYNKGQANVEAKWESERKERLFAIAEQDAIDRAKEREWASELQFAQDQLAQATQDTQAELDTAIADIRTDNLRLRDRFRSCSRDLSKASESTSGNDETSQGGLSPEDEKLALRIGAEADQVVHQLTACQRYVSSITQ